MKINVYTDTDSINPVYTLDTRDLIAFQHLYKTPVDTDSITRQCVSIDQDRVLNLVGTAIAAQYRSELAATPLPAQTKHKDKS